MEIMERIAQALNILYPDTEVYFDDIPQNAKLPCFVLQFISLRDIKIAGIKCNKVYSVDIVYSAETDSNVFECINRLEKEITKKLKFISYEIEIIDKDGHFIIELMGENPKIKDPYQADGFYKTLSETVERLSNKKCYFLSVNLDDVDFEQGFYVLKPVSLESTTISLNHKKEYEQDIELVYLENSSKNIMSVLRENEIFMEKLAEDLYFRKHYINLDYSINYEEEEEEKYFTDVASFIATLTIKRRG
ncbi:phage tail terminator family protein [Fusobacterium gastrosuis]|uniref:phage tail terminator family protein n=1 Tax=Fusobacterium gastrosuis TaxID=1755100 RepID=UPI002A9B1D11|nr:hypothetical protein [Fusobacterium gastrosuis]MDY5795457.1 hypothetical protein [Fusobacterium gastrosuis]